LILIYSIFNNKKFQFFKINIIIIDYKEILKNLDKINIYPRNNWRYIFAFGVGLLTGPLIIPLEIGTMAIKVPFYVMRRIHL
jgi:hypothetical protein